MSYDHFYRFFSVEKERRIKLMFEVYTTGLTFWIDRACEMPEWSFDYIQINRDKVEKELRQLFENIIEVEYKGTTTTIRLFDKGGAMTRQFKDIIAFKINWFSRKTVDTYRPYFENE